MTCRRSSCHRQSFDHSPEGHSVASLIARLPPGPSVAAVPSAAMIAQQVAGKAARDALCLSSFHVRALSVMKAASAVLSLERSASHGQSNHGEFLVARFTQPHERTLQVRTAEVSEMMSSSDELQMASRTTAGKA